MTHAESQTKSRLAAKTLLLAPALLATLFSITACASNATGAKRELTSTADAIEQIYSFESDANGFNTKTIFYDNGEEVVAFDTQFTPAAAEQALAFLRTKTTHPIRFAVITHPNPDKFNGMSVFQRAGATIIASQATVGAMPSVQAYKQNYFVNVAKMFTNDSYPPLGHVDQTFAQSFTLQLRNGDTVLLSELAQPGVSANQTVALIPALNSLVVGDLIHNGVHAWLEGGIVNGMPHPTLAGWIADLKELQQSFPSHPTVYGGRGSAGPLDSSVRAQIAYLETADQIVSDYVSQVVPQFGDRSSELTGAHQGMHFQALQTRFEKAYPSYGLSYLIQYGVYGLADSKL